MADVITGDTQLGPTKQEVIAEAVQRELQAATNLRPLVTDVSSFARKGAKSIDFPKLESFSVTLRQSGQSGEAQTIAATTDRLLLDQPAYIAYIIDPNDEVQSTINAQLEYAVRAASAHGRYVDERIIATAEAEGIPLDSGTTGDITRDIVLEMRKMIRKNHGDLNRSWLVISPDQEEAMLKISQFSDADVFGQAVVPTGTIGRVYGVPVVINNQLADQQYFMWEQSSLTIGFQLAENMSEQPDNQYGSTAMRVAIDQLFGTKAMQVGKGAVFGTSSQSALIIKDAN